MALQELLPEDVQFKITKGGQLGDIRLLQQYVTAHDLMVDFRDGFPREISPDSPARYYPDQIYKYDITTPALDPKRRFGCAQFIVDEAKIILRPFYPTEDYSVEQRDLILEDFVLYLSETNTIFERN